MGQLLERRRAVRRFVRHFKKARKYTRNLIRSNEWRTVLYDADDLVQEAAMVLWRLIEYYPDLKGIELVKCFRHVFRNHLINTYRKKLVKAERRAIPFDPLACEADQTRKGIVNRILPWDFFRIRLSGLSARLDREKYKRLIDVPSRINDEYLRRKEAELRDFL